jgi:hypothetical protein
MSWSVQSCDVETRAGREEVAANSHWDIGSDSSSRDGDGDWDVDSDIVGCSSTVDLGQTLGDRAETPVPPPALDEPDLVASSLVPARTPSHIRPSRSRSPSRSTASPSPRRADRIVFVSMSRQMKPPARLPSCSWWSTPLFHGVAQFLARLPEKPLRPLQLESLCGGMASEIWVSQVAL